MWDALGGIAIFVFGVACGVGVIYIMAKMSP